MTNDMLVRSDNYTPIYEGACMEYTVIPGLFIPYPLQILWCISDPNYNPLYMQYMRICFILFFYSPFWSVGGGGGGGGGVGTK